MSELLSVKLICDAKNSKLIEVVDSLGFVLTENFINFSNINKFPLSTQSEIEMAIEKYVSSNKSLL
jgi:hypothetical protein